MIHHLLNLLENEKPPCRSTFPRISSATVFAA